MSAHPIDPHIAVIARIHPQAAINYIEALHAIDAILAPRRPVAAIEASEYENIASNRASIESDIEAAIIETPPLPQIDIDPSPLTDDEIAYGQRIADNPEWDRPGIPLETVLAKNATTDDIMRFSVSEGGVREAVSVTIETDETAHELELVETERHALSVMVAETVPPTSETTPPRESDGQQPASVRRPKGLTKLRAKVWEWIDQNAGDDHNTDTLSVNKVKAGAGCARGVAGEVLSLYRSWYTDTSRKDKAS